MGQPWTSTDACARRRDATGPVDDLRRLHRKMCEGRGMSDDPAVDYPWLVHRDERFTLTLILDVGEVLVRHRYAALAGATLVDFTNGLYRALHPTPYLPPPLKRPSSARTLRTSQPDTLVSGYAESGEADVQDPSPGHF